MKLVIAESYEEMSRLAARELLGAIYGQPDRRVNLSVTSGKTPVGLYELAAPVVRSLGVGEVHFYNFDEISVKGRPSLTATALRQMFFTPAAIPESHIHLLDESNYWEYDACLERAGGIDMIMMGLGADGHFCGNLSTTVDDFGAGVRFVSNRLNPVIEERMAFLSGGRENMTEGYVTFGPRTVMNCRRIVMIVNGAHKAAIAARAIKGPVDPLVPASVLQLHPNITWLLDAEAAAQL